MKNHKFYFKLNLIFIFVVLNVWEFALNRVIFNAMVLGLIMFGPLALMWFTGKFRAIVLLTLVSIIEFVIFFIFVAESMQLSGSGSYSKSLFLVPYLIFAALNGYWGLAIYTKKRGR